MDYKSEVYVRTDGENRIVCVDGGYTKNNIKDISQWIKIDEGYGNRYNLCQNNYFPMNIITEGGAYRYKLVDGKPVECTAEEIAAQEEANKPAPSPSGDLESRVSAVESDVASLTAAIEKGLSL